MLYQKIGALCNNLDSGACCDLFMHLYNGHSKLGDVYRRLHEEYLSQLVDYFTFYSNEITSVEELLARRKSTGDQLEIVEKKLRKKKEQRFALKDGWTWELEPSALVKLKAMITDKALAFQEMFPRESMEFRKIKMLYGYYTNKVAEEFTKLLAKNEKHFRAQFGKVLLSCVDRETELAEIWDETLQKVKKAIPSVRVQKKQ